VRHPAVALWLVVLAGTVEAALLDGRPIDAPAHPYIVGGELTSAYPSTGALLLGDSPDAARSWCTGVLIGCQTFLTAAHCVCDTVGRQCQGPGTPSADGWFVFFQHAGFFRVVSIRVHPRYDFPAGDVAVLRLATPVTGIAPARINALPPIAGAPGTIVGFGRTGGDAQDYGLKRVGTVTTTACREGISESTSICWSFDGSGANSCNGDSGGPLFMDFGAGTVVAGLTSGGDSDTCLANDFDFDSNLYRYASWIQSQTGADVERTQCGGVPQAGDAGTTVMGFTGTLDSGTREGRQAIDVPPGTNELRIALEGTDDGKADFDLYVRATTPPTTTASDCHAGGRGQYAYCRFLFPAAGTWHALAFRKAGAGIYQLTATIVGGAPPVCGNNLVESGEECDGADSEVCPGACDANCRCKAVCEGGNLLPVRVRLGSRFVVRTLLLNELGAYDGLDPSASEFALTVGDPVPLALVIPARDAGWNPARADEGRWEWRGQAGSLGPLVLHCKRRRDGNWDIVVTGRQEH